MSRGQGMRDPSTARTVRPGRRHDTDQPPTYAGHDALFPPGSVDLDPHRHDTFGPCWGPIGPLHDTHSPAPWRFWADCADCRTTLEARSEKRLTEKAIEHVRWCRFDHRLTVENTYWDASGFKCRECDRGV